MATGRLDPAPEDRYDEESERYFDQFRYSRSTVPASYSAVDAGLIFLLHIHLNVILDIHFDIFCPLGCPAPPSRWGLPFTSKFFRQPLSFNRGCPYIKNPLK